MTAQVMKSTFVTTVAWLFIVLAGFSTFMTGLQNIMLFFFFPKQEIKQQMAVHHSSDQIPDLFMFLFSYFDYFFLLAFVTSATMLIGAIGLLKRKNWARITFMTLISLGVLWNIFGIFMQFYASSSMSEFGHQPLEFKMMQNVILGVSAAMALVFTSLFVWIILKLNSEPIKREFH
ncbi:MAG: hypothetical protein D6B25_08975 [Desulfobulbaceae bacterium]|nr:MAG: hypothetical protein D6B25_08975 [Desulfobulbaceae bacterium]